MQLSNCGRRVGKTEGSASSRAPDAQTGPTPEGVPAPASQGRYLKHRQTDYRVTSRHFWHLPSTPHGPALTPRSVSLVSSHSTGQPRRGKQRRERLRGTQPSYAPPSREAGPRLSLSVSGPLPGPRLSAPLTVKHTLGAVALNPESRFNRLESLLVSP